MKCRDVVVVLMFLLLATSLVHAQEIVNLFDNPGFEEGTGTDVQEIPGWRLYIQENASGLLTVDTEEALEGKQCVLIEVTGVPAGGTWNLRFEHTRRFSVQQGETYTMSFWLKGDPGPITLSPSRAEQNAAGQWGNLAQAVVNPTAQWREYHLTFVSPEDRLVMWQLLISNPGQKYYVDHARCYVGEYVPDQIGPRLQADSPSPSDRATDVPRDAVLGWTPGEFAQRHNVYLGTSFDDVNTAALSQAVSQDQTGTTFQPTDPLEYGQTYFWRVDEVNAAPSNTVFKGGVWSFTAEPYAYPVTGITATASSSEKTTTGPENTINRSGLTGDLHGTNSGTMWSTSMAAAAAGPAWIQYQFPSPCKLSEMWVWNHNTDFEPVLGFGFKDVTIEYSLDGQTWTLLGETQFAQATAVAGYAHNTTVDMGGIVAQYVRLTAQSNWSMVGVKQYGLSEVRFFSVPVQARAPQPAQNAEGVAVESTLDWRPGREATSHQVVFGTDPTAVADGTATAETVTSHGFDPGALDFGTTYYWKVDEVGTATYPGTLWSFTTREYAVVDDFESYTDDEGSRIYEAWIDGWTNNTGSVVGYLQAPFAETVILHGGKQAMPFEYNNVKSPYYSEAERTFDAPQDWTTNGADTLALWYQGFPTGFTDNGNNAFTVVSTGTDIWGNSDQFRFAYRQLSGDGSITAKVESVTRSDGWTKAGVMIRETLSADSKHASCVVTPDNSCSQQYRNSPGGASASTDWSGAAVQAPYWVRVTRTGNSFKTETSPDGKTWTALGNPVTITMVPNVYIGLCVTSHNAAAYSTAEFSNVSTTGAGAWQSVSIGVTQRSNGIAPLYLIVEDKAGKSKTVVNPDEAAVTKGVWTQWKIPLTDLSGVNVAAIKTLTIGVGDPANPQAPDAQQPSGLGAGMLYLDDIGFGHPAQ
jgi:regulation of enolase protein 1 (concanavalin A-like superfamily)